MAKSAAGIIEIKSWSAGMVVLDCMAKAADVRVVQAELNDLMGVCIKLAGDTSNVEAAIAAGKAAAERMQISAVGTVIPSPSDGFAQSALAKKEFSPLIEQDVVHEPQKDQNMGEQAPFAIGFIETQGFTAVIEAIDTACKAANVEVMGREKLGGGYISVVLRGDVAAVRAAVEAGKSKVEGLGKLIASHVIARPSAAVLSLLPKG